MKKKRSFDVSGLRKLLEEHEMRRSKIKSGSVQIQVGSWLFCHSKVPITKINELLVQLDSWKEETRVLGEITKKDESYKYAPSALLRKLRETAQTSQVELAEMLGIHRANLTAIENGRRSIGKKLAMKLGKIFEIDYKRFL